MQQLLGLEEPEVKKLIFEFLGVKILGVKISRKEFLLWGSNSRMKNLALDSEKKFN